MLSAYIWKKKARGEEEGSEKDKKGQG